MCVCVYIYIYIYIYIYGIELNRILCFVDLASLHNLVNKANLMHSFS